SLVRKIVFDMNKLTPETQVPELGCTVGDALLEPTRIYVKTVLSLLEKFGGGSSPEAGIHGIAHITGGGLEENLSRILPENVKLEIKPNSWQKPEVFNWLQKLGNVESDEMARVFNMGIGLVLVVKPEIAEQVMQNIEYKSWIIGKCK
ncbi:MAG: AIR synthase-related protein, partial [Thermoguttaceae bacterium]